MANKYTVVKDRGYNAAIKNLKSFFDTDEIAVGIQSDQFTKPHPKGKHTIGQIAAVHEFGSKDGTIPQRSFIRKSIDEPAANRAISAMILKEARKVLRGSIRSRQAMDRIGLLGVAIIQRFVQRGKVRPLLAIETIKRKGSSTPLFDSGRMIQSVRHKVRPK